MTGASRSASTDTVPVELFLVGAMKAGTSNLQDRLADHPSVEFSHLKEPNYFLFEGGRPDFTGPGDEKINRLAVRTLEAYRDLYRRAPVGAVRGDASTTYLFDPDVAERISARRPDARIVIVLRNPIDRAYSAFNHLRRDRREPHEDFERALAEEEARAERGWGPLRMQESVRRYAEQVRRYLERFLQIRVGLNSGEVVVRAIGSDLHMDYTAVGETTHLAARMEQLATPGSILLTAATLWLVEGLVRVNALGPISLKVLLVP